MEALCRLCLARDCHIKSITDYEEQKHRPGELQQLIAEATGIQIEQDDLPKGLCGSCAGMVVSVVKFRRKCQRINESVKSMKESLKEVHLEEPPEFVEIIQEAPDSPDSFFGKQVEIEVLEEEIKVTPRKRGPKKKPNTGKIIFPKDPGLCDICGQHFNYIRSHKLKHESYKKHCCQVCGKRFTMSCNLRKHERYHAEPQFSCEICGKRLYKKEKLKYHIMTHTDERPFACEVCQKSFREKKNLVVHFRIHTGEKPYGCPICDTRFTTKAGLSQHRKHNHKGDSRLEKE